MIILIKLIFVALGLIATFFAVYSFMNRKTLKLGYSQMPAETIDFITIYMLPFLLFLVAFTL